MRNINLTVLVSWGHNLSRDHMTGVTAGTAWRGLEASRVKVLVSHDELGGAPVKGATLPAPASCGHVET